jgi:PAS domain S-box-containing protein
MTDYPILGQISILLAALALATTACSSARVLRAVLPPAAAWFALGWSVLTLVLVLAKVLQQAWPQQWPAGATAFFNSWIVAAAPVALFVLTLLDVWLMQRGLHRVGQYRAEMDETQRRAESLLDRLPELVFSLDPAGRIATVNAAAVPLLGFTPAELIGQRFNALIVSAERDAVERSWQAFTATPGTRSDVLPIILETRTGEQIPMLISASVRRDAGGGFAGVDGIARDNRAWQAYERAMREHAENLEHLFTLALTMGSSLELNEQLERLLDITQSAIGFDAANVFVLEGGDKHVVAQRGYADPEKLRAVVLKMETPASIESMRQRRRPVIVQDAQADPDWIFTDGAPDVRSWLGAPLLVRDEMIGIINLDCRRPNRYTEADAKLLGSIAAQAAAAIHNARLFGRIQEQANHLRQLNDRLLALQAASLTLAQASSVQQALRTVRLVVKDLISDTLPAFFIRTDAEQEMAELLLLGPEDEAYTEAWRAAGVDVAGKRFSLKGWASQRRTPLVIDRLSTLFGPVLPAAAVDGLQERYGVRAFVSLPMWSRDRLLGYMLLGRRRKFTDQDMDLLSALATIVAVTVDNLRLLEDLRRASRELDKVIASSMDAIVVVTQGDVLAVWNPAAERIFGQSAAEMVGRRMDEIPQSSVRPLIRSFSRRVLAGESLNIAEYEYPRPDGRRLWLSGHGAPILDNNGVITGALFMIQDTTQERAAKRQMQQTEKLSALGQLAAGVAHELNNPLTSIIGYAQLLASSSADAQTQSDLERIIRQGKRAARIVQNLLTFVGEHEPRRVSTDINDVLRTALEMRQYEFQAGNIAVSMELADDVPATLADYHQLQQVFFNLLLNAEQAMLEANNGGQMVIRSRLLDGKTIHVEVQDDGPGIPSESLSRIFDPFFTTKTVGKGTGLGLSICYGIIEEHGGTIRAESEPGHGATFIVEIPVAPVRPRA